MLFRTAIAALALAFAARVEPAFACPPGTVKVGACFCFQEKAGPAQFSSLEFAGAQWTGATEPDLGQPPSIAEDAPASCGAAKEKPATPEGDHATVNAAPLLPGCPKGFHPIGACDCVENTRLEKIVAREGAGQACLDAEAKRTGRAVFARKGDGKFEIAAAPARKRMPASPAVPLFYGGRPGAKPFRTGETTGRLPDAVAPSPNGAPGAGPAEGERGYVSGARRAEAALQANTAPPCNQWDAPLAGAGVSSACHSRGFKDKMYNRFWMEFR